MSLALAVNRVVRSLARPALLVAARGVSSSAVVSAPMQRSVPMMRRAVYKADEDDDDDDEDDEDEDQEEESFDEEEEEYIEPEEFVPILDDLGRAYATGRRKTSVARVWLKEGSGQVVINNRTVLDYFQPAQRAHILEPFGVSCTSGMYDVMCTVKGGGVTGQAGAVRLGISRALEKFDNTYRPPLKAAGMMTRDSRRVERKKPGLKKARKQYQWVKR